MKERMEVDISVSNKRLMDNKTVGVIGKFLNENAPTLAIGGAIGTLIGVVFTAFKASREVSSIGEKYDEKVKNIESEAISEAEKSVKMKDAKSERNVKYFLAYKWVGLLGIASISLMIASNAMNGAKIATLTTIAVANQDKLKKLAENGRNMIGEEPWKKVEDKTIDDIISENLFGEDGPKVKRINPKAGNLFVDTNLESARPLLFQVEEKDLKDALDRAEKYYEMNGHTIDMCKYYEILGFPPAPEGSKWLVWGPKNPLKVHIGTRECGGITFPSLEYEHRPCSPKDAGTQKVKYYLNDEARDKWEKDHEREENDGYV